MGEPPGKVINQEGKGASQTLPRVRLADLLRGNREAVIEHNGQDYRLRLTASGKLILTK